jgi:peptidoglycan hydrolase-like protein with peptidoglycan-binding domain
MAVLAFGAWLLVGQWSPDPMPLARADGRASPADLAWQRHEAEAREAALQIVRRRQAQEKAAVDAAEEELRQEDAARARERAAAAAEAVRHRHEVERQILQKLDADAAAKGKAEAAREAETAQQVAATEAAADAQQQADAADLDAARAGEAALQLSPLDRQHLQVALNALGFSVDGLNGGLDGAGGVDGDFGPLTRGALAGWQEAQGDAATGFLTAAQEQRLLQDNARAIANFDAMHDLPGAERREAALGLSPLDRRHVQVALGVLGFDPGEADGLFGQRSRQMIAAWQTAHGDAPTGFLTADQARALVGDPGAAVAIATFDTARRKVAVSTAGN